MAGHGHAQRLLHGAVGGSTDTYVLPKVTVWVALTDTKRPLEFFKGSHVANLKHKCAKQHGRFSKPYPNGTISDLESPCLKRLAQDCEIIGYEDIKAGDVILWYMQTYHWGLAGETYRLALSVQTFDADQVSQQCDQNVNV